MTTPGPSPFGIAKDAALQAWHDWKKTLTTGAFTHTDGVRFVQMLDARFEPLEQEAQARAARPSPWQWEWNLRAEWFVNHGHDSRQQYTDDGELQCQACAPLGAWDYRRTPLAELQVVVDKARHEHLVRALEAAKPSPPAQDGGRP